LNVPREDATEHQPFILIMNSRLGTSNGIIEIKWRVIPGQGDMNGSETLQLSQACVYQLAFIEVQKGRLRLELNLETTGRCSVG
jgi:hypothetical protein